MTEKKWLPENPCGVFELLRGRIAICDGVNDSSN